MIQKKWKVTFGVLGIATFFFLWAALNLWTSRAYHPGIEKTPWREVCPQCSGKCPIWDLCRSLRSIGSRQCRG